jgi:3-deoxy-D-manno-octulosonic-acid transferase
MWSILHDIFVTFGLGLHLLWRWLRGRWRGDKSIDEYAAYRAGLRIGDLHVNESGRPLLWFHGVSVGEVAALDGVIAAVRERTANGAAIAVSTMTSEGLRAARRLSNQPELAFIYPLDLSWFAKRVVERLRPRLLVIFDGDFWFQMLDACGDAQVPVMLINGRLGEGSARNYGRVSSYSRRLFSQIALASVQSEAMADRFAPLVPRSRIAVDGNLKLDSAPQAVSDARREELRRPFGIDRARFCFVFGSVHPEELDAIAGPIRRLLARHADVQVVIAPRHPDKFTRAIVDKYFPGVAATWSGNASESAVEGAPLVWVNRLGVLRELYQVAQAAFVGGTFCDVGGHNLAEPAQWGVPALYGPQVHAQIPLHEMLQTYGAARQVRTPEQLYQAMTALVEGRSGPEMAANLARLRAESAGLTARVAARITRLAKLD